MISFWLNKGKEEEALLFEIKNDLKKRKVLPLFLFIR